MNKGQLFIFTLLSLIIIFLARQSQGATAVKIATYGELNCAKDGFFCQTITEKTSQIVKKTKHGEKIITVNSPQTWEELWPCTAEREIIMKLNRLNIPLKKNMVIAVPNNLAKKSLMDFSPWEKKITPPTERLLMFDPGLLAWAAYNPDGALLRWGPAVGGKPHNRTTVGEFRIFKISGPKCRSGKYCAPMPWAMFFNPAGYAFHGSNLPGYNASHGCVRMFVDDALWLNKNFVEIKTKVIIKPYPQ